MREVLLDGSPAAVAELMRALGAALDGVGPAVAPLEVGRVAELRSALGVGLPLEDDTALVVATSGSTGDAKGVLLSASALRASASATVSRLGGVGRWLLALPAQHIAGIQVLVRSLLGGSSPVLVRPGGFRGKAFAEAASELLGGEGPCYTALVPTQLSRLLAEGGDGLAALRAFDAVLLGGAATPGALLVRAVDAGVRVVTTYGMTETAGGCVYDGVPLSGVRVRIGAGERIELSGPMLASGYRLRPGDPAFADGWFRTDDLGRLHRDGSLEVLGRADDVINTGGVKVSAAVVEGVLAAQPGVAEACVVGVPDAEWGHLVVAAVVPLDGGAPPDVGVLGSAVRVELGAAAVPKMIRFVGALPLHGPGKVDRSAVVAGFAGGAQR